MFAMNRFRLFLFAPALALCLAIASCSDGPPADGSPVLLASGANISGANGLHMGPDGLLYVASVVGSDVTVLDPDSGAVVRRYGAAEGVIGPDDVAFAADGSWFWTSILTGEVAGFNADGQRVVAAQLPPGPNPVTFSDDGRLFVSQCFLGVNLYELDPAGIEPPRLISDELGPGCGLNGMDWGADGRLYGPRWFTGEVVSFDVDSGAMRVEATGFATPAAVKFNSRGQLHVLDTGRGEVVRIDGSKRMVTVTLEPGLDNLAFDERDRLFVSSFTDGSVRRVDADGSVTTLQPGGMAHPGGVAVQDDLVLVADIHAVRGFDAASGKLRYVERNLVGVGAMGGALNIAVDGEHFILTSWFDGDVRVWDPRARQRVAHYPSLQGPVAAVRYRGRIAVAEHGLRHVAWLSEDGEREVIAGDLPAPTGLAVADGRLYVSDRSLGQVLLIAVDGWPLPTPQVMADRLAAPEGLAMSEAGLVVVEADLGHVTRLAADGQRQVLARLPVGSEAGSPLQPPSQVFNGIAADADGRLFVTDETSRSLYRLDP